MSKRKKGVSDLDKCRTGDDYINYASKQDDVNITWGKHCKVSNPRGCVAIPPGKKQLGKGIACVIKKAFIAMGLGIFILFVLVNYSMFGV